MKIKFKQQQFQIDAVKSVVDCFRGQLNKFSNFQLDTCRTKSRKQLSRQASLKELVLKITIELTKTDVKEYKKSSIEKRTKTLG